PCKRFGQEQARGRGAAVEVDLRAAVGDRVVDRHRKVEAVPAGDMTRPGLGAGRRRGGANDVVGPNLVLEVRQPPGAGAEGGLGGRVPEVDRRAARQKREAQAYGPSPATLHPQETIHRNPTPSPRPGRLSAVGVTSIAVSTGASRPPGRPAATGTPALGSKTSPPPIPGLRGVVRPDTPPEPVRVRSPLVGRNQQLATLSDVV